MIFWIDAQISPRLCPWISRRCRVDVVHVRDLGLREAEDPQIFDRARKPGVVVLTKDDDFVDLVRRFGKPPQVLWVRCGNMSNARLKDVLARTLADALDLLRQGEAVVEIGFASSRGRRPKSAAQRRARTRRA